MLDAGWTSGPPVNRRRPNRALAVVVVLVGLALTAAAMAALSGSPSGEPGASGRTGQVDAVIGGSAPSSWDPALTGDAGSASTLAQVYESLTALDAQNVARPALASSWQVTDEGRRVTFQLRNGISFSDGRPITADDVVHSWLRVLDPARPSPLASLLGDVVGANAYVSGFGSTADVGIKASGSQVIVTFRRPAAYFPSSASSPTLAVVPTDFPSSAAGKTLPPGLVVSGAYLPTEQTDTAIRLEASPRYWAGTPALKQVELRTSLEGRSPVDVFQSDEIDVVSISPDDAAWIRYDRDLGPQLRQAVNLSIAYYGFDTRRPPFDKADVRRAFAQAIDWHRIVTLDDPSAEPATSLVPPGIAGRSDEDLSPHFDPVAARAALANAGFPDGKGFPQVTIVTSGGTYEKAVAKELEQNLGVKASVEVMPFDQYSQRLITDPPQIWSLDWIADYPHPQDFLGLLLESDSTSNTGHWSNAAYDAAIEKAASTSDAQAQARAYADAERIVQDQAPLIPLRYGESWSLTRTGLLGANESGVGFIRIAGMAWSGR